MKITDLLPGWRAATLWASKYSFFTTRNLACARIKIGRQSDDQGLGPRSPAKVEAYQAPDGRYFHVTIREIRVSDDDLRTELREASALLDP